MHSAPLQAPSLEMGHDGLPDSLPSHTTPLGIASVAPLALSRDVPGSRLATLPDACANTLLVSRSGPYLPQLAQPPTRKSQRPAWREAMLALLIAGAAPPGNEVPTRVLWSALLRRARAEAAYLGAMSHPQLAQAWVTAIESAISGRQAAARNRSRA